MPRLWLGNRSAVEVRELENASGGPPVLQRTVLPPGKRCTTADIPDAMELVEALVTITNPAGGMWSFHADEPPAWVASDWPELAAALAAHWGCELRDPEPGE